MSSNSISSDEESNQSVDQMIDYVIQNYVPRLIQPPRIRSRNIRRDYLDRERESGHARLYNDYFHPNPVYPGNIFRRRFRMRRHVFLRLVQAAEAYDEFFQQRPDATGRLSMSSLQKCTAAIRMLAYGASADSVDEYLRLSQSTARLSIEKFTEAIITQFSNEYLRRPTVRDLERLLRIGEERGFPGMMGSIDCMHWEWKNCPAGWRAQYQGRSGKATLVLEAVASRDLWIWHSFFGVPGSCNDLNVLYRSPVFDDILEGRAPPVSFMVNGHQYDMGYYLTDGIYPKWATFIQSITLPQTRKDKLFAQRQEAARKDVERAFGVLQSRFAILRNPSLAWDDVILRKIMMACIIMHNMIVEDERDTYANYDDMREFDAVDSISEGESFEYSSNRIVDINIYLANRNRIRDRDTHLSLKANLVEHVWQRYGETCNN